MYCRVRVADVTKQRYSQCEDAKAVIQGRCGVGRRESPDEWPPEQHSPRGATVQEEWLQMCEAERRDNVSAEYGSDMLNARSKNREMPPSDSDSGE